MFVATNSNKQSPVKSVGALTYPVLPVSAVAITMTTTHTHYAFQ